MLKLKENISNNFELILTSYLDLCDMQEFGMNIYWLDEDSADSLYLVGYNNLSEQYTGFSMQNYLHLRIEEIFPNVLKFGIKQKYIDFIKNKERNSLYRNTYNDNRIDHKEFQIRLLNLSKNCMGVVFQDISEQVRIKKDLDRFNNYYKSLFEIMMEGVVIYEATQDGQDFLIKDCNKSAEQIEKVSKQSILGRKVSEVFPDIKNFGLFDVFLNVYQTGTTEYYPIHFYKDDRIQGWRENYVYKANTGEIIAVYRDLSKQIESEKNISFPDQNPNPVLRVNKKGKILYYNAASRPLLEFWGCDKENTLPEIWIENINQIISNKLIRTEEINYQKRIYLLTLTPIPEEQYLNIYGWEITKTRILEQNLAQNQKMEAIGRLAGGIAHDFNNFLTGIQGFTELLLDEPNLTEKVHEFLEQILKASKNASKITNQLLTFSRKQTYTSEVINLNSIIESSRGFLKHLMTANINLHYNLSNDLWSILAESNQIQQILMNLLINSRDAIENKGNIQINTQNISFEEELEEVFFKIPPGDYVLLTISDTGKGMDKDTLSHLFEPFFTTKELGKGTGLGLSIVYNIIKQFQGYIIPYSQIGLGTIFKLYFPRNKQFNDLSVGKQEDFVIKKPIIDGKILIVEDDEVVRNYITQLLSDYRVLTSNGYVQAIEIAQKEKSSIQLLISNIIMPGMNGKQLSNVITSINPNLKVLFISGYTQEFISQEVSINEDIHYLRKPFTLKQLLDKLRVIFHQ